MISKKEFLKRLKFIMDYSERVNKFDEALKDFAESDFTGFYDEKLQNHLLDMLITDMEDSTDLISWWLYDCPEAGKAEEYCKIYVKDGDEDDFTWVRTPEELYDYIFITNTKAPSKESVKAIIKAQDNGVKFALKELEHMKSNNAKTKNKNWEGIPIVDPPLGNDTFLCGDRGNTVQVPEDLPQDRKKPETVHLTDPFLRGIIPRFLRCSSFLLCILFPRLFPCLLHLLLEVFPGFLSLLLPDGAVLQKSLPQVCIGQYL